MSKELSTQNTNHFEKRMNSAILKAIATTELCHIAPLLSLAREVDSRENIGLSYSTCVDDVQIKDVGSYMVMRIAMSTVVTSEVKTQKIVNVLYTFRMITQSIFEPFIYINKNTQNSTAFAYVDEDEFLFSNAASSEEETLNKIYQEAREADKKVLFRYVDLIRSGFKNGKLRKGI